MRTLNIDTLRKVCENRKVPLRGIVSRSDMIRDVVTWVRLRPAANVNSVNGD